MTNKFVFFGCWNEGVCNIDEIPNTKGYGMSHVMKALIEGAAEGDDDKPDFYIIGGDNYYPNKVKKKYNVFNRSDFISGFDCASKLHTETGKPVHMLMGNHDLQYENSLHNPDGGKALGKCTIIENQVEYNNSNDNIFNFNLNSENVRETLNSINDTLILYITPTIYTEKVNEVAECFNIYNSEYGEKDMDIHQIIAAEKFRVETDIKNYEKFKGGPPKNIIVIGHEPIASLSFKKGVKRFAPLTREGIELLTYIYGYWETDGIEKYYICADIHNYQKGIVNIPGIEKGGEPQSITQYVVGTGGTGLDKYCGEEGARLGSSADEDVSIVVETCNQGSFGYLECTEDKGELMFEFKVAAPDVPLGEGQEGQEGKEGKEERGAARRARRVRVEIIT